MTTMITIDKAIETWEGLDNAPGSLTWEEWRQESGMEAGDLCLACDVTRERIRAALPAELPEDYDELLSLVCETASQLWEADIRAGA